MAEELILMIEDNEKNRKLMRDVLRFQGYKTAESENAEEGLRMAGTLAPALILMDIHLPGMNGIEALGALRADPATRGIPVMAVTASVMPQDHQMVTSAGFDAYQSKPINVKEFVAAIKELLKRPRKEGKSP
jgi:two-component system, cell cycle response regulator DivK